MNILILWCQKIISPLFFFFFFLTFIHPLPLVYSFVVICHVLAKLTPITAQREVIMYSENKTLVCT